MATQPVKVLYLSYDGLTDPLGQSQVLPYLIGLSKKGFQFTVLSFEKKDKLQKIGKKIEEITEKANINWVPLSFTARPPILAKIYDRYRMRKTALSLHRKHGFQMTHCRSYVSAEVGLRLKEKFGVKMLFDMRGFWADEKVDNGQWDLSKRIYRSIYAHYKKKESEFLLKSDGIVSLTQAGKDCLLKQKAYEHLCIEVIPCCADLEHFNYKRIAEEKKQALRKTLHIPETAKIISYVGSFGGWYMTKEMFTFVNMLQKKHPDYIMLFLTKDDPEKVRKEARECGIEADKFVVEFAERQQLPVYMAISDCSIFFIRNTFSKTASSPTKHAELMGMGIPVICNTIGDTGEIIAGTKTGWLVDSFDEESYQQCIAKIQLLENIDKEYIRNCASQLFDLQTGVQKYLYLYTRINASHLTPKPEHSPA